MGAIIQDFDGTRSDGALYLLGLGSLPGVKAGHGVWPEPGGCKKLKVRIRDILGKNRTFDRVHTVRLLPWSSALSIP